jgi:dephospho-CoA kinase
MIVLGLTGSIGMGKSTTAGLFAQAGAPVHDADAAVARCYAKGGAGVGPVSQAFPEAVINGAIDRERLSAMVLGDTEALKRLEAIVHPLVKQDRQDFLARARAAGAPVAVLDVPLLFEIGAESEVDAVVVVSAPPAVQRERTLLRPGMTPAKFARILARQLPDAEKRARADFVVDTGRGVEIAAEQVNAVLKIITAQGWRGRKDARSCGASNRPA